MSTNTETVGDVEIETSLFEELSEEIPCSYVGCQEVATHILVCGACYVGREFMCGPHTELTAQIKREAPEIPVIFNETCGHTPEYGNCPIEPITA